MTKRTYSKKKPHSTKHKKYKKTYKKHQHSNIKTSIQKQLVCSDCQFVKLKYPSTFTPDITLVNGQVFITSPLLRLNGLFDVDAAIGNPAVPGFTQWMAFYRNYRVLGAKVDCTVINTISGTSAGNDNLRAIYFGMAAYPPGPDSFAAANSWTRHRQLIESNKYGRMLFLPSQGSDNKGMMKMYVNMDDCLGAKNQYRTDLSYAGDAGSNPANVCSLQLFAGTGDGTVNASGNDYPIQYKLDITFYTEFFNSLKQLV